MKFANELKQIVDKKQSLLEKQEYNRIPELVECLKKRCLERAKDGLSYINIFKLEPEDDKYVLRYQKSKDLLIKMLLDEGFRVFYFGGDYGTYGIKITW